MERSKELSFSVRNSGDAAHQAGFTGASRDGFMGDLQLLAGEELEARLQIHDRIGGGSSARVYRGTLDGTMAVAIKVLHPHAAQRDATLQEFLREAQILARLQHKHIVRLHALAHLPPNFGGLPTRRFTWGIITEYMEAGTLTKLVQDASKVYKQQQRIRQQLAAAAAAAASAGGPPTPPERTSSLRQLKNSLSFLRRRSLTPGDTSNGNGGGGGTGGGGGGGAPMLPSPRNRPGTAGGGGGGGPSPMLSGGGAGPPGMSSRQPSVTALEVPQLPYTDREALHWCMEVALALQFLHAQTPPVVHRDVKTDNVLMALAPPPPAQPPSSARGGGVESGLAAVAAAGLSSAGGAASERDRGVAGVLGTHGSLVRRVLSMRMAAALASEGLASRAGSITAILGRPGGGRPLTAKVCDFGLHVVLDVSRPVVTVRRRSFEASYTGDGGAGSGSVLPHSCSLTRPSARNSPAGSVPGGPLGSVGPASGGLHMGVPGPGSGRHEARSRRPSLMSNRATEEVQSPYRRAVSREGDSFSRAQQGGFARKTSNLTHGDSPDPSGSQSAAAAAALSSSPPKVAPFSGAAAAAAAAAAAFGTNGVMVGGMARLSSTASTAVGGGGPTGLRVGSSGTVVRSPKTSVPGCALGPQKWSGGSAMALPQTGSVAAVRASLDLLLQGRVSAATAVAAVSQSGAGGGGSHSGMLMAGGSVAGGYGGHTHSNLGEGLSAGQVMLQLQGSNAGVSDRTSRLRPSYAGPSGNATADLPACLSIDAAVKLSNRSGGGRPSATALPGTSGPSNGNNSGSCLPEQPLSGGGTGGRTLGARPGAGSPAASSKGGGGGVRPFRSNAAQVAQYLAMMEEDLQLDIASRSSSKAQAELDPLYGPGSRPGSLSTAARSAHNSGLLGTAPAPGPGGGGGGGGPGLGTPSNRSLLSGGASQGHMPGVGAAQMLQGTVSTSRLSPAGKQRNSPGALIRRPSQPGGTMGGRMASSNSLLVASAGSAAAHLGRVGLSGSGAGMAVAAAAMLAVHSSVGSPGTAGGGGASGGGTDAGSVDSPGRLLRVRSDASARSEVAAAATVAAGAAAVSAPVPAAALVPVQEAGNADAAAHSDPLATAPDPAAAPAATNASGPDSTPSPSQAHASPPAAGPAPPSAVSESRTLALPALNLDSAAAGGHHSGAPSPLRGPNPSKSSSQPAMSVTIDTAVAGVAAGGALAASPGAARPPTLRTVSTGSRAMSKLGVVSGPHASGGGGGVASGGAAVGATPASPTDSVHPMDLSPPAARLIKKSSGRRLVSPAMAVSESGKDEALRQRQDSAGLTSPFVRRKHQPLEVSVPEDSLGPIVRVSSGASLPQGGSATSTAVTSLTRGSFSRTYGTGSGALPGRGSVGTSEGDRASVGGGAAGGGAVAGRVWAATAQSASASASPRPRLGSTPAGGASDNGSYPNAHAAGGAAAAAPGPRELHKVVKRLRPDGGGSFTANSPLGLPPHSPSAHPDGGGSASGGGGSFSYSRRASMDAVSYLSIGSARSATAAMQAGGGGVPLHREKLLWGRGLLTGGVGGGGGSLAHSAGAVPYNSDPNSPASSTGVPLGGSGVLARHVAPLRGVPGPPGSLPGIGGGGGGVGGAAESVGAGARTTSGGVSGTSGGNSDERSARQPSITRRSSSTHSHVAGSGVWSDYPHGPGPAAIRPDGSVLSRAPTGTSLRVGPGGGGGGGGGPSSLGPLPSGAGSGLVPTALVSPMLAHVTGAGSQTSSAGPCLPARMVSESAASGTTLGGWTGRDEMPPQGEAAYALTGRAGTLLYMAPEVIRHEPYNEKVDVFSFGVVLYEVFGRVLLLESYSKDELESLSARIAQGFRHHRPDCMPAAIWDIVQQCWAQNPPDRPAMPMVVRQLELALEAMVEAEAAAAAASGAHRAVSQLGDAGGGGVPGSPLAGGNSGPGSGAAGPKDRSSGRSVVSHRSLVSMGSLGRRSRGGISFRRRPSMPRQQPQPQAPTPGRQPPPPATASAGPFGSEYSTAASNLLNSASLLASPASRGSVGGPPESPRHEAAPQPRCAPCGCVIS